MKGECYILLLVYGVAASAPYNDTLAQKDAANRCRVCGPLAAVGGSAAQACSRGGRPASAPAPAQLCSAHQPYCTIIAQGKISNISRVCHEKDYGKFCLLSHEEKSKSYSLACTCKSESCKKIQEDARMRLFSNFTEQVKSRNETLDQAALKNIFGGGAIAIQKDGNVLVGRAKIKNTSITTSSSKPLKEQPRDIEGLKEATSQKPQTNIVPNIKGTWPIADPVAGALVEARPEAAALVETRGPADDDDDGDVDDGEGSGGLTRLQGTLGPAKSVYEQFTTSPVDSQSLSNTIDTDYHLLILSILASSFVFVH